MMEIAGAKKELGHISIKHRQVLHDSMKFYIIVQMNGLPPNFIHSLDSTHMMLTTLGCRKAGITFAAVHDCYWTHAATVNEMNRICRKQFVELHSLPILEDLSQVTFFYKTTFTNV